MPPIPTRLVVHVTTDDPTAVIANGQFVTPAQYLVLHDKFRRPLESLIPLFTHDLVMSRNLVDPFTGAVIPPRPTRPIQTGVAPWSSRHPDYCPKMSLLELLSGRLYGLTAHADCSYLQRSLFGLDFDARVASLGIPHYKMGLPQRDSLAVWKAAPVEVQTYYYQIAVTLKAQWTVGRPPSDVRWLVEAWTMLQHAAHVRFLHRKGMKTYQIPPTRGNPAILNVDTYSVSPFSTRAIIEKDKTRLPTPAEIVMPELLLGRLMLILIRDSPVHGLVKAIDHAATLAIHLIIEVSGGFRLRSQPLLGAGILIRVPMTECMIML